MNLCLRGKVALITGSSSGIGFGIAKELNSEGCQVVLNGRNSKKLESSVASLSNSFGVEGDFTNPEDALRVVKSAISAFGKLDILVCNVGSGRSVKPGNESLPEWKNVFACNLWSATNAVEAAKPHLKMTSGVIVCISSICGVEMIPNAPVTYSAAKAALNTYVKCIAKPLAEDGVRINAIAPGNILFKGSVWHNRSLSEPNVVKRMLEQDIPLGRFGLIEDVAKLAAFLSSPSSGFATGEVYKIDGGQTRS